MPVLVAVAWLWWRRSRGEQQANWIGVTLLGLLLLLLLELIAAVNQSPAKVNLAAIEAQYLDLWLRLDTVAERTQSQLDAMPQNDAELLQTFEVLTELTSRPPGASTTILLLDSSGVPVAWSGRGLLHDLRPERLPDSGRTFIAGFGAATLLSVRGLDQDSPGWRVLVGRSLRTEDLPFDRPARDQPIPWTLVDSDYSVPSGALRIAPQETPHLILEKRSSLATAGRQAPPSTWRRLARVLWAMVLLGFVGFRRVGATAVQEQPGLANLVFDLLLVNTAVWTLTGIRTFPLWVPIWLTAGLSLALIGHSKGPIVKGTTRGVIWGALTALGVYWASWGLQVVGSPLDLGSRISGTPLEIGARLAISVLVAGLLALVGRQPESGERTSMPVLILVLILLSLAAFRLDVAPWVALFVVAAGCAAGLWASRAVYPMRLGSMVTLGLLAAGIGAVCWEGGFRIAAQNRAETYWLPALAPPTDEELEEVSDRVAEFIADLDATDLAPAAVAELDRQDLAFEIWRRSPMSAFGSPSAVSVLPDAGPASAFAYGLALDSQGLVDPSAANWPSSDLPVWRDAVATGVGELELDGKSWAQVVYWLALQPGFRLAGQQYEDLAAGLLRARPARGSLETALPNEVSYALFDRQGNPRLTPWKEPFALPEALLEGGRMPASTPGGSAILFADRSRDGVRVVLTYFLSAAEGLERIGTHALTAVGLIVLLIVLAQLPRLKRVGWRRAWAWIWRSYSRRLAAVYSVLLLLPLVLLNVLIVRALEERMRREQEMAGESAIESAQEILGEYFMTLEPGFGIESALGDEQLDWLARVVHHDVNVYWRGRVYASSKDELFTAGLLPRRIPGEIYSLLTLTSQPVATRVNRTAGAEYLELYAPLRAPGTSLARSRLFLSVPLLAQQEETAVEIASLRRRALLGTAALILLINVIGVLLARRFTRPLTEIVEGTARIAAGATSLQLRPSELELETLVGAIDAMAERIAEARQRLLAEKRVVDRIVDNVTAGIISLDEHRRVLMRNQVAFDLIGIGIGDALDDSLGADSGHLAPLREFLSRIDQRSVEHDTVHFERQDGQAEEWTLVWVPLPGSGEPSALLVLEDVTEVLQGQRLQAWAEMARMIAHEIKNPLTPIRLSAEHMREVYGTNPAGFESVFENCTNNILKQVGELQEIASEFSTYSRIPKIEPKKGDLAAVVEELVRGYSAAAPPEMAIRFEAQPQKVVTTFDAKLMARAVRNLIENALRAIRDAGEVRVAVSSHEHQARVSVSDDGPGVDAEQVQRIFDPYFSTHDSGTGLGLPIARRIVEEHGGEIKAQNRGAGGLVVTIILPMR